MHTYTHTHTHHCKNITRKNNNNDNVMKLDFTVFAREITMACVVTLLNE